MPLSEESITLVTSYRPSIIMMPYRIPSFRAGARMLCGQTGNRIVPLSEESMTLMTPYRPSVIMMPYRILSFRAGARMLCEKNGKQDSATERRIYYPDDVLPLSSLRQIFSVFTS